MRSFDDGTSSQVPNAFTPWFLRRIGERDEPPTAGEADVAGPWRIEPIPGEGFGLFREGESLERGFGPAGWPSSGAGRSWMAGFPVPKPSVSWG